MGRERGDLAHGYGETLAPALRRLRGVRLIIGDSRVRAEVYGIGHRYPATIPVSLALASRLVAAGVPLTVHVERREATGSTLGATI